MEAQIIPELSDMRNYVESNIATDGILSGGEHSKLAKYLEEIDKHYCTLRLLKGSLDASSGRYDTCAKGMDDADDLRHLIRGIIGRSNQLAEEKKKAGK